MALYTRKPTEENMKKKKKKAKPLTQGEKKNQRKT